jgi:hypothetical protein
MTVRSVTLEVRTLSQNFFQDQLAAEDSRPPVLDVGTVVSVGDGIAHACTGVKHVSLVSYLSSQTGL